MPALSIFQVLPPHIVRAIVNYVSGSSRVFYYDVRKGTDSFYQLQKPLLRVCHNFQAAVLSNFGRVFTMGIRQHAQYTLPMWDSPPLDIDQPDSSLFHLAKELVVYLDIWSLCADSKSEFMIPDIYRDDAFPHVRLVKFEIDDFDPDEAFQILSSDALANAETNVQRILRMAPRVSEVEMVTDISSGDLPDNSQAQFSDLLARLFQLATRVRHFSVVSGIILNQQMCLVRNLVHLSYEITDGGSINFVHLARQCAPTLQSLSMETSQYDDIIGLVRDSNGNCVQYPRLLLLEHLVDADIEPEDLVVDSGAIPFPRLKSLIFRRCYPFGDDTPFRGNAATLEGLSLTLNHLSVETFRRHQLFTSASHPALRYVDIRIDDFEELGHDIDWANLLEFSLGVGPCAPMRKIDYLHYKDPTWIQVFPSFDTHQNIQVLELPKFCLALHDSIRLVKSLPLLSDLHALAPCLGEELAGVDLDQLAAYFATKQLPAGLGSLLPHDIFTSVSGSWGGQFRFWRIVNVSREKLVEAVHCMLLLALLCPNFDYAAPPRDRHQSFMDTLEEAIDTDSFRPYAIRLRRLLFTIR
ncbi:hypothetical protein H4218_001177 [Coemansia sp. IMI 209128]|nr:hypothetical protein H4218_001177 [Coemansia sp. IMI 209128]